MPVNLHGLSLKNLGGDGTLSTILPYDVPQAWSLAVHRHSELVDRFVYMSRHMNNEEALVLFDRAKPKILVREAIAFADFPGAARVLMDFHVISR